MDNTTSETTETASDGKPQALDEDQQHAIDIYNGTRWSLGIGPLAWSWPLANEAQLWANHLAGLPLGHRSCTLRMRDEGTNDNITACSGRIPFDKPLTAAARRARKEEKEWPCRRCAGKAGKGKAVIGRDCGMDCSGMHMQYTQMVWEDTTHVGMACATNPHTGHQYTVVRFKPGGNIVGEAPY